MMTMGAFKKCKSKLIHEPCKLFTRGVFKHRFIFQSAIHLHLFHIVFNLFSVYIQIDTHCFAFTYAHMCTSCSFPERWRMICTAMATLLKNFFTIGNSSFRPFASVVCAYLHLRQSSVHIAPQSQDGYGQKASYMPALIASLHLVRVIHQRQFADSDPSSELTRSNSTCYSSLR